MSKARKKQPKKAAAPTVEDGKRISVVFTLDEAHAVRVCAAEHDLSMSKFIKTTLGEAGVFDDIDSEFCP